MGRRIRGREERRMAKGRRVLVMSFDDYKDPGEFLNRERKKKRESRRRSFNRLCSRCRTAGAIMFSGVLFFIASILIFVAGTL